MAMFLFPVLLMLRDQRKRGTGRTDNKKHVICVSDDRYCFFLYFIFDSHFIQKNEKREKKVTDE